ncbi:hypothetical protein [Halostagnicola sp. A-GB9-2]|uniref:hypothetical protein n=1 Tax=Halostagnicola sp. A-GB9-2 TaxID=3048066 RepID=UPI0024BF2EDF|nr:hypothetical protein [Halostagnicola sp. A-GB9-2]MDJ1431553.1 hypothetical protein [Halostagnicola sp. A-GB9-2]
MVSGSIDLPGVLLLAFLLLLVAGAWCLCYAVAVDASARGASGSLWGFVTFVLLPVAIPADLVYRTRLPERTDSSSKIERWAGSFGIGATAAWALATTIAPPDPFTLVLLTFPAALVLVPLSMNLCYGVGPGSAQVQ